MLKSQTVQMVGVSDWDHFISETYGKPYMFQQQDGCKERGVDYITVPSEWTNDYEETSIPFKVNGQVMGVSFSTWLNTSPEDTIQHFQSDGTPEFDNNLFWERNFYPNVQMIANDLHAKGLLEAGEYLIVIDW